MTVRLLYGLILIAMGINGALYAAWFLSPPNPDRVGFFLVVYFIVFPILAWKAIGSVKTVLMG